MNKKDFEELKKLGFDILIHLLNDLNETEKYMQEADEKEKKFSQTCYALGLFAKKIKNKELFVDFKYRRILENIELNNSKEEIKPKEKIQNDYKSQIKCPSCGFIQFPDVEYFMLSFYKCKECQEIIDKVDWNKVNLCERCKKQIDVVAERCYFCEPIS